MKHYSARLYAKDAGHGKQVTVTVTNHILIVQNNSTPTEIELANLEVKLGGFSHDRIIMVNKLTGESIVTKDQAILDDLTRANIPVDFLQQAKTVKFGMKTKPGQRLASWGLAGAGMLVIAAIGYAILDPVTFYIASHMPSSIEKEMGNSVLDSYAKSHELENTSSKARRVKTIGTKLVENLKVRKYDFNFYVEPSKEINAFATPGGNIVVLTELIKKANDDELACVLAHEIGHVIERHSLKSALRNAGLITTLQVITARSSEAAADALSGLIQVEGLRFDREQEKEADLTGVKLAWESGYNPSALIDFMHKLEKEYPETSNTLSILSDHPMPADRAEYIADEVKLLERQAESANNVPPPTKDHLRSIHESRHESPPPGVLINLARIADGNYHNKQFEKASSIYGRLLKEAELNPDPDLNGIFDSLQNYITIKKTQEQEPEVTELRSRLHNLAGKVYSAYVQQTFQSKWMPPESITSVVVSFKVQPNGSITGLRVKQSGSPECDQAALATVKQCSPLARPPKILAAPIAIDFKFDQNVEH